MGRKQLPPQPPPYRGGGRKAPARDTFQAGRSYQAVARRLSGSGEFFPPGRLPHRQAASAGRRSRPKSRADGWLHRP